MKRTWIDWLRDLSERLRRVSRRSFARREFLGAMVAAVAAGVLPWRRFKRAVADKPRNETTAKLQGARWLWTDAKGTEVEKDEPWGWPVLELVLDGEVLQLDRNEYGLNQQHYPFPHWYPGFVGHDAFSAWLGGGISLIHCSSREENNPIKVVFCISSGKWASTVIHRAQLSDDFASSDHPKPCAYLRTKRVIQALSKDEKRERVARLAAPLPAPLVKAWGERLADPDWEPPDLPGYTEDPMILALLRDFDRAVDDGTVYPGQIDLRKVEHS